MRTTKGIPSPFSKIVTVYGLFKHMPSEITHVLYEETSNMLIVQGSRNGIQELINIINESRIYPAPKVTVGTPDYKVLEVLLRQNTGEIEVQVLVEDWSQDLVRLLTQAGLAVTSSDQDNKLVTGTIDAEKVIALAWLSYVAEIRPLDRKLPTANRKTAY